VPAARFFIDQLMTDQLEFAHFETLQLHAGFLRLTFRLTCSGQTVDKNYGARAVPIYSTAAYTFKDYAHGARLYSSRYLLD